MSEASYLHPPYAIKAYKGTSYLRYRTNYCVPVFVAPHLSQQLLHGILRIKFQYNVVD